jgi:DNA polymerase-3 subunit gamma/tau
MYLSLYRKWRPTTFDDVCGQDEITDILKYEVANKKTSHAYLFCGSRGTGKTSCAKILAKAINCESPKDGNPCNCCPSCRSIDLGTATDVIEMDAASNTGVDNVRDIKEEIIFTPASLKFRVYIIDEVHMMSGGAFNALLKTLEEPPSHVVFILATTELQKLPSTIISRCQRFDFRRMTTEVIVSRLKYVAENENIQLESDGARLIAKSAQGGMRDALSLLELCAGMKETINESLVTKILGIGNRDSIRDLVISILNKDYSALYSHISDIVMSAKDISVYWKEIIEFYRDILVTKNLGAKAKAYLDLTDAEAETLQALAKAFSSEQLLFHSKMLEEAFYNMGKANVSKRSIAELTLTRMCDARLTTTPESLLARIFELENTVSLLKHGIKQSDTTDFQQSNSTDVTSTDLPNTSKAPPISPEKASNEKTVTKANTDDFRMLFCWNEILESIGKTKKGLYGLLDSSSCYVNNNTYVIKVKNPFLAKMIASEENLSSIKAAMISTGELNPPEKIIVESEQENTLNANFLIEELAKDNNLF